ncbi:MAG: SMC-Scp complex subunit ScpB [Candidatus Margulisiibacteriota bacterium]
MDSQLIKKILEALLFVAREPLSLEELELAINTPREELKILLEEMISERQDRGIQIFKVAGGYLMGTNPDFADYVKKITNPREETRLSPQALETLAIIAYKQPVTRVEIERLRGVDSGWVIETLIAKKLIQEVGRSETVGRPYLYGTTEEFLKHFGLESLAGLPPLPISEAEQELLFKSALHEKGE